MSLLEFYRGIYGTTDALDEVIAEVTERLKLKGNCGYTARNPRGAGRRPTIKDYEERVIALRESNKSIREISRETGISIGSVHKLINEHALKAAKNNDI